jgi:hypothetical protein
MGLPTLRVACIVTAAVLIAGCGGASQVASSTPRTVTTGPPKPAQARTTARTTRARPSASRFPPSIESSFRRICKQNFRRALARAPVQDRAAISGVLAGYCTCALRRVEGSVATQRFKHDIAAFVSGQARLPAYMFSAQRVCGAQLQLTLAVLAQG